MNRRGLVLGVTAYLIWGLFPLYWPLLEPAGAIEILAHRMVWSLVVMLVVLTALRGWGALRRAGQRTWLLVGLGAVTIAVNWGVYIYAVNHDQVVDAALGYFINPLVSVVTGVLFFGERLRPALWAAVGLGAVAVVVIGIAGGHVPWISLVLAASFAGYGVVKKVVALPPPASLTAEGLVLLLPALAYLTLIRVHGNDTLVGHGTGHVLLLILSGLVTVVPLLAFAGAAQLLPLSILGLLQYLTPMAQFLLGVLWAHEHMPPARWIGFICVWAALAVMTADGLMTARRAAARGRAVRSAAAYADPGVSESGPARTG